MALVSKLERKDIERPTLHKAIGATYSYFERDGRRLLQIDSYGSSEREMPGKKSQSFQFDEQVARQLFDILRSEFDLK